MKLQQLAMGARFEYEGVTYVKTGPMTASSDAGGQRIIPRYANLRVLEEPVAESKAPIKGRLEAVLRELTPRERMVFEMRHYQGMRLRAIGEVLGTSEEAAKNCLFRATQKLRAALGDFL